jgi:hypothetical protein
MLIRFNMIVLQYCTVHKVDQLTWQLWFELRQQQPPAASAAQAKQTQRVLVDEVVRNKRCPGWTSDCHSLNTQDKSKLTLLQQQAKGADIQG